ncbi:hypothetical protein ABT354_16840 [Streptomyces sp. NPDC000594]|uniref:hypothetical protein n=1 Tax=Streptomyces sp. NPDC000594 TaxID=3154261 RepID=UPI0033200626
MILFRRTLPPTPSAQSRMPPAGFRPQEPPDLLARLLTALQLDLYSVTEVYDDLNDLVGEHATTEPETEAVQRLAAALDHILLRIQAPELAVRCPPDTVRRAQRARACAYSEGAQPSLADARGLALAVLNLLDLVGEQL